MIAKAALAALLMAGVAGVAACGSSGTADAHAPSGHASLSVSAPPGTQPDIVYGAMPAVDGQAIYVAVSGRATSSTPGCSTSGASARVVREDDRTVVLAAFAHTEGRVPRGTTMCGARIDGYITMRLPLRAPLGTRDVYDVTGRRVTVLPAVAVPEPSYLPAGFEGDGALQISQASLVRLPGRNDLPVVIERDYRKGQASLQIIALSPDALAAIPAGWCVRGRAVGSFLVRVCTRPPLVGIPAVSRQELQKVAAGLS